MATVTSKRKAKPKSRRPAKSQLSELPVNDPSDDHVRSSFSPSGDLFAFVSLAVDKHRLRVYNVTTGHSVAEYVLDSSSVTALAWVETETTDLQNVPDEAPPKRRKKKATNATHTQDSVGSVSCVPLIALGLSNGTCQLFSPTHGRVLRTLSHPACTTPILAIAAAPGASAAQLLWTSGADGAVRSWSMQRNEMAGSWRNDSRVPYTSLAIRHGTEGRTNILAANHSIHLLSVSPASLLDMSGPQKPEELCSFTGHASRVQNLLWDESISPPTRFFSTAEGDRFVYIWEVPSDASSEGKMVASIPLDSDARQIALSRSSGRKNLLAVSASGRTSLSVIPTELKAPAGSKKTLVHKIPTLDSRSTIQLGAQKQTSPYEVISAAFVADKEGRVLLARSSGGVKLAFDVVKYLDDDGEHIAEVIVDLSATSDVINGSSRTGAPHSRYLESSRLSIITGEQLGQDPSMDDLSMRDIEGNLDVDLAELSLGQRLTAISGADLPNMRSAGSDQDPDADPALAKADKVGARALVVPANSLSRMLIQALHSSDKGLLETCLSHSDVTLIENTVRKLPPQLAVPLLDACVERLGRGGRASNMKGRGGGASSQRGMGLIRWVRAVLSVHSGHLMTMPDLVARLAGLHATLTTRLTLQERLLSLNGRLDVVLSQVELRSSAAPAPVTSRRKRGKKKVITAVADKRQPYRYVEGESSEEDAEDKMEVEADDDNGDDHGSVEEIEFGRESDDDSTEEDSEDESSGNIDEDNEDDMGPTLNGFIDDMAEDDYAQDDSEEESE